MKTSITDKDVGLRRSLVELGSKLGENEHLSYFLKRNTRIFFQVFFFVLGWLIIFLLFTYKDTYSSNAKIIIRNSATTDSYLIGNQQNYLLSTSTGLRDPVLNIIEQMDSSLVPEKLWFFFRQKHLSELQKLKINTKKKWFKFISKPPKHWCKFLKLKNVSATDVVNVSFTWTDPKIAQESLEVAIKAFQEKNLELNKLENKKRSEYLDSQVKVIEKQAEELRKQKSEYKEKINVSDLAEKSKKLTVLREETVNNLNDIESRLKGRKAEVKRYQALLGMSPEEAVDATGIGQNPTYAKLRDDYYAEYSNLALLKVTYTNKSPQVRESQEKIKAYETKIKEEAKKSITSKRPFKNFTHITDQARGTVVQNMSLSYADDAFLGERYRALKTYLNKIDAEIALIPKYERDLDEIAQKQMSLNKSMDILRQQQIEAHLKEQETTTSLFVVDKPNLPIKANSPNLFHWAIISLFLGFFLSSVFVIAFNLMRFCGLHLVDYLNNRIKNFEENKYKTQYSQFDDQKDLSALLKKMVKDEELIQLLDKEGPKKFIEVLQELTGNNQLSASEIIQKLKER